MASTDPDPSEKGEALRLYLRLEVDPFLLRALTELLLHQPRDAPGALRRYLAWRLVQRRAHTEAFAAAGGGLDYEGDARLPPWLEGLEGMEGGEDGEGYAALRVAPVLRALVRHVLAGAGAGGGLPVGEALEEGMLAFLESWAGGEVGMVAAGTEEDAEAAGVAAAVPEELAAVSAAPLGGDVTLLVLGLGGAGKSTVVAALQGEADAQPAPTTGFHPRTAVLAAGGADKQQEQQERQQRLLHLHDVGGAEAIRGIWPSYYHDAHGVVWVTACADMDAWRAADLPLLRECLAHPFLAGKPLLVLLNHRAGADAGAEPLVTADALREELLQQVAATAIDPSLLRVQACVAHAGGGNGGAGAVDARIEEGVAWLVGAVGREGAALRARVRGDTAAAGAALAAALAWKDRELLRALLEKAAAMVGGDGVGAEAGEREEGVLSKEQALVYLADALETDGGADTLDPVAAALAARVGYQRAGLQLLAEMRRRAADWDAVAEMVEAAAGVTAA